jgi:hypothetical protein
MGDWFSQVVEDAVERYDRTPDWVKPIVVTGGTRAVRRRPESVFEGYQRQLAEKVAERSGVPLATVELVLASYRLEAAYGAIS